MYELEGLFCKTALSGINWKFAGQEKNTIGLNLQASPIERKNKRVGRWGQLTQWALARLEER